MILQVVNHSWCAFEEYDKTTNAETEVTTGNRSFVESVNGAKSTTCDASEHLKDQYDLVHSMICKYLYRYII